MVNTCITDTSHARLIHIWSNKHRNDPGANSKTKGCFVVSNKFSMRLVYQVFRYFHVFYTNNLKSKDSYFCMY